MATTDLTEMNVGELTLETLAPMVLFSQQSPVSLDQLFGTFESSGASQLQRGEYARAREVVKKIVERKEAYKFACQVDVSAVRDWVNILRVRIMLRAGAGSAGDMRLLKSKTVKEIAEHFRNYAIGVGERVGKRIETSIGYGGYYDDRKSTFNIGLGRNAIKAGDYPERYALLAGYAFVLGQEATKESG